VLLGVPYDGGSTYQTGARLAPYHLRRVSALVQSYHPIHGVDVFARLPAVDGGNIVIPPFDAAATRAVIERSVLDVVSTGAAPVIAGGDHTLTLPSLRAVAKAHGPVAVVHVDAHFDTSGPEVWGDAFHHGTPLRHALEEKLIAPGQLFQVGMRGPWGHPEEGLFSSLRGASVHSMDAVEARGVASIADEVRQRVGGRPVYLTIDIDGIDPAFAPGTGLPVPGGLSSREVLRFVRGLAGCKLVGMDLVEVAPGLDHADITCHLGAALLYEALALIALTLDA
jgi:agmatinase